MLAQVDDSGKQSIASLQIRNFTITLKLLIKKITPEIYKVIFTK